MYYYYFYYYYYYYILLYIANSKLLYKHKTVKCSTVEYTTRKFKRDHIWDQRSRFSSFFYEAFRANSQFVCIEKKNWHEGLKIWISLS